MLLFKIRVYFDLPDGVSEPQRFLYKICETFIRVIMHYQKFLKFIDSICKIRNAKYMKIRIS